MHDFILFCIKSAVGGILTLAAIYMAAYMFNSGWQAGNYNFWKKKSREIEDKKLKRGT